MCLWLEALVVWTVLKYVEVAIEMLIYLANTGQVFEPVAVVGSRPHGSKLAIKQLIEALLADLMRSVDPDAPIRVEETIDDVRAEHVPCSTC